jgi:predicted Zn finger-like uncharacterized protein
MITGMGLAQILAFGGLIARLARVTSPNRSGQIRGLTKMRLICPNCGAQYDVADDAIPESGRDVQCSNCNHIWFQIEKTPAPAPTTDASAPLSQPARKPLDPAVSDILREEAAREQQLRASATKAPRPTQDDTSPKTTIDAAETRRRIAEMTEAEAEPDVSTAPAPKPVTAVRVATARGAAQELRVTAPQPTEDTSTRAQAPEPELTPAEQAEAITRRGFRRGFVFVLMIFAVLFGPYVFADQITTRIPQTADAMASYVSMVDGWRLTLNQTAGALGDMIADVTAGPESQPDQN